MILLMHGCINKESLLQLLITWTCTYCTCKHDYWIEHCLRKGLHLFWLKDFLLCASWKLKHFQPSIYNQSWHMAAIMKNLCFGNHPRNIVWHQHCRLEHYLRKRLHVWILVTQSAETGAVYLSHRDFKDLLKPFEFCV